MQQPELLLALCHISDNLIRHFSHAFSNANDGTCETLTENYAWNIEKHDVLVIPSLSFSAKELCNIEGIHHYEERALYVLFALNDPSTRLTVVTSAPIDTWILRYHFSLLPPHRRNDCENRITFYSVGDTSDNYCLTEKILNHPRLLDRLKRRTSSSHGDIKRVMMVYRATFHEEKLARILGLELHAAKPEQAIYGTKNGSRSIFRRLGIPCADGTYKAEKDLSVLAKSMWKVLRRNPGATKGIVKLSDGFAGIGNAIIDVTKVQQCLMQIEERLDSTDLSLKKLTQEALETMTFHSHNWKTFSAELKEMGAIFELFIGIHKGSAKATSPSAQVVISEDGSVSVLSTHEQILEDQVYEGCEFPCRIEYREQLMAHAKTIGEFLSGCNVRDRFGVDFLCVPRSKCNKWDIFAVEINLRTTGTTHPWMTMKLLTHGKTDSKTGIFKSAAGGQKCYLSSDHVSDPSLKRLAPQDLYELMMHRLDLHWDYNRETGVIFHMIGRMPEGGVVSMTAIGNSSEEARTLFYKCRDYIIAEAKEDVCRL